MQVREIMTPDPMCCTPETSLREVSRMMVEGDCGEIPVVDGSKRPVGVVTDRDIACRAVAEGKNPLRMRAREIMTSPVITVEPDTSIDDCCRKMEQAKVRRVPVVDQSGACCGIVAQADIALKTNEHETAEMVRDVSQPGQGSRPGYQA